MNLKPLHTHLAVNTAHSLSVYILELLE
ncbi:hypothetical protein [Bartonella taylorii]|uniref:Uncharacterized protein n=1 Tax=Bartonella taylorii TaxID=33046 RepID=A0A9Q8YZA2_BARTA|nr:hypothetical protein [Bartonella taylorii]USP03647.1 hypothetical protein LAJ60_04300 [Bartonella taylorii]